nr:hypothetical protein [uncultured Mediterranean phage uvMED]
MANILGSIDFDPMQDDQSGFLSGNLFWHVTTLISAAEEQKCTRFKHNLASCHFHDYKQSMNPLDMARRFIRIRDADLDYPIILCPYGEILDGGHRVARALVEGKIWLWAYRLKAMPKPDRDESDA